jgi:hypothetical protein
MSTGAAITLIAVGAILRFALAAGSAPRMRRDARKAIFTPVTGCPFTREPADA